MGALETHGRGARGRNRCRHALPQTVTPLQAQLEDVRERIKAVDEAIGMFPWSAAFATSARSADAVGLCF